MGLNTETLHDSHLHANSKKWGAKDVQSSTLEGLVRSQESQQPEKGGTWVVGQDRNLAHFLHAPASAHLLHVLTLRFIFTPERL